MRSESTVRVMLWCGVFAPLLLVAFVVAAALVTDGHNCLSDTISQLGIHGRPNPWVINTGFILCGLLMVCFAYGLYGRLGSGAGVKTVSLLLAVGSLGIALAGILHADPDAPGVVRTLEGDLHNAFAGVAYVAFLSGTAIFAAAVCRRAAWRGFTQMSLGVFALSAVLLLVYASGAASSIEGGLQLSFFGALLVWLEAVALRSLRLPSDARRAGSFRESGPKK